MLTEEEFELMNWEKPEAPAWAVSTVDECVDLVEFVGQEHGFDDSFGNVGAYVSQQAKPAGIFPPMVRVWLGGNLVGITNAKAARHLAQALLAAAADLDDITKGGDR